MLLLQVRAQMMGNSAPSASSLKSTPAAASTTTASSLAPNSSAAAAATNSGGSGSVSPRPISPRSSASSGRCNSFLSETLNGGFKYKSFPFQVYAPQVLQEASGSEAASDELSRCCCSANNSSGRRATTPSSFRHKRQGPLAAAAAPAEASPAGGGRSISRKSPCRSDRSGLGIRPQSSAAASKDGGGAAAGGGGGRRELEKELGSTTRALGAKVLDFEKRKRVLNSNTSSSG